MRHIGRSWLTSSDLTERVVPLRVAGFPRLAYFGWPKRNTLNTPVSVVDSSHSVIPAARDAAVNTQGDPGASRGRNGRGWLVRRALLSADALGLVSAFVITAALFGMTGGDSGTLSLLGEYLLFLATLPAWLFVAKLYELYDRDEERTEHTTLDDFIAVLHLITVGVWLLYAGSKLTGLADPELPKVVSFWALSILLVTGGRAGARAVCRRLPAYRQRALIVGAGEIGQLVARKLLQHPEYGIDFLGFVDGNPLSLRSDLGSHRVLGGPERLEDLVLANRVERVIVAFSNESPQETAATLAKLKPLGIQIDIVPRLFEIVGPNVRFTPSKDCPSSVAVFRALPFSRGTQATIDVLSRPSRS